MVMPAEEINLTPQQEAIVAAFMKQFPEASRFTAVKFCYGRKFELARVFPLYEAYKQIVSERGLETLTATDTLAELRTQKMYIPGSRDLKGAALFVVQASKHVPGQFPPDQTIKLAFYLGECLTSNLKTQAHGVTLILDLNGMEWSSFDATFMAEIINFFQNHIPAAVKNILIWRAPWWIKSAVKIVSPFLKEKMRRRIKMCDNLFALEEFVAVSQLPTDFGGAFEYDHDYFIRRELSKASTEDVLAALTGTEPLDLSKPRELELLPDAMLLVDPQVEVELQHERDMLIDSITEQINDFGRSKTVGESGYPIPLYEILHNRALRLRLDVAVSATQALGPAAVARRRSSDPIHIIWREIETITDEAERTRRMQAALIQDRRQFLKQNA